MNNTYHLIHVNANNDRNGNPRRAYIILHTSGPFFRREVIREDYAPLGLETHALTITRLSISAGDYRRLLK